MVNPALRFLGLGITRRCNLSCNYCSRCAGPEQHIDLPVDVACDILSDACNIAEGKSINVALTGGEALLHPHFWKIVREASQLPVLLSLNSNGINLTPKFIDRCIDIGLSTFNISIEGPKNVYKALVKPEKELISILANVKTAVRLGGKVYLSCTVLPYNVAYLNDVISLASDYGVNAISFSRCYPVGRAIRNYKDLFVSWSLFVNAITNAKSAAPSSLNVFVEDRVLSQYFNGKSQRRVNGSEKEWDGCMAGVSGVQIDADGTVLPCAFFSLPAGNVHQTGLAEIWKRSSLLIAIRSRDNLKGACGACSYKYQCGGCRGRAYGIYGDYFAEDPLCPCSAMHAEGLPD
jgi:radical SAM protein with 4Fe4S-binding SPASM domain